MIMEKVVNKTIEERAREAYPVEEYNVFAELKIKAYIQGAKEQRAIDEAARLKDCGMAESEREEILDEVYAWLKENAWSFARSFDGEPYYDTEMMIDALERAMK